MVLNLQLDICHYGHGGHDCHKICPQYGKGDTTNSPIADGEVADGINNETVDKASTNPDWRLVSASISFDGPQTLPALFSAFLAWDWCSSLLLRSVASPSWWLPLV
jgi:hypothetical protein